MILLIVYLALLVFSVHWLDRRWRVASAARADAFLLKSSRRSGSVLLFPSAPLRAGRARAAERSWGRV